MPGDGGGSSGGATQLLLRNGCLGELLGVLTVGPQSKISTVGQKWKK